MERKRGEVYRLRSDVILLLHPILSGLMFDCSTLSSYLAFSILNLDFRECGFESEWLWPLTRNAFFV